MAFGDLAQAAVVGTGASGNASATLGSGATAGNLLRMIVGRAVPHTAGGDWGDNGGSWTLVQSSPINSGNFAMAMWVKVAAGGETAITTSGTNESGAWTAILEEFVGAFESSPLDDSAEDETNLGTNTTTKNCGSVDTSVADTLILAAAGCDVGTSFGTLSWSDGFSATTQQTSGGRPGIAGSKKVLTGTATGVTTTLSYSAGGAADEMYGCIGAFKKLAAGGIVIPVLMNQYRQRWN